MPSNTYSVRSVLSNASGIYLRLSGDGKRLIKKIKPTNSLIPDEVHLYPSGEVDTTSNVPERKKPKAISINLIYRFWLFLLSLNPFGDSNALRGGAIVFDQDRILAVDEDNRTVIDLLSGEEFSYELRGTAFVVAPLVARVFKTLMALCGSYLTQTSSVQVLITPQQINEVAQGVVAGVIKKEAPKVIAQSLRKNPKLTQRMKDLEKIARLLDMSH